ncbi:hypothetical protein [Advenella alkanexedens]|uniref:hypothetical protein n=1 Tax=Advenella alkanexedens TaxID=1481665 RepID=UPI002676B118|nr:hypothetical protein [Advenella alkanexedens]WKU18655.1 hypothetical protein Q3V95_10115 [Advenella alkanexedens]
MIFQKKSKNLTLSSEFEGINTRLKHEFSLKKDADVAGLLSLTPQAFYSRKKDNNFPKERLIQFLKNNAEQYSYIDLRYILTGESESEAAAKEIAPPTNWHALSETINTVFLEKLLQLPSYLQEQFIKQSKEHLDTLIHLQNKIKFLESKTKKEDEIKP